MNKLTLIILLLLIIAGCSNNNSSGNANNSNDSIPQTGKSIPINPHRKIKYLFIANGGIVGFYDDGTVTGCPRCDTDGSIDDLLNGIEPYGTYKEYPTYLLVDGETKWELYENGSITSGWFTINYHRVDFQEQITDFSTYSKSLINPDSIQEIKETCLIELMPEIKHFDNEESEEAQNYFTAMDDLGYYMAETRTKFENIGVNSVLAKKRYLLFTIDKNEQILVDTYKEQNGWTVHAFLYRKEKTPIMVNLVDADMENMKNYLKN